ncbi:cyclin-dependent kinase 12-like [Sipha flava]|uniref:Cyclin-dependent kinase 12-like n=1 Tax=Sipha flava TaxID=143950 RepID=A0A8B8FQN9_9HEMI|nr:cyclin-dependent kinase 12-like [Sipha flava]
MTNGQRMTAEEVKKATMATLRADPALWAAYNRGRADQAAEVRRVLNVAPTTLPETKPVATTPAPQPRTTSTPTPKPSTPEPPIRWVKPVSGQPLHPSRLTADSHPSTTEWTGMPSRVAYQGRLPSSLALPKTKPGSLEPWPAPTPALANSEDPGRPALSNKAIRKRQRDAERRAEFKRRKSKEARKRMELATSGSETLRELDF